MELTTEQVIRQTQHWISNVVIGCGFCPFAYKVWADKSIGYTVVNDTALHTHGALLLQEISKMDVDPALETVLLIFPLAYKHFSAYLSFLKQCEKLMSRKGYDGVYQLASFHPDYVFEGDQPPIIPTARPTPCCTCCAKPALKAPLAKWQTPMRYHKGISGLPGKRDWTI
jgi:hypothetical protein